MATQPLKIPRTCSQCGLNGHNTRTCTELANQNTVVNINDGVKLFGVMISSSPIMNNSSSSNNNNNNNNSPLSSCSSTNFKRKCMSMNNLAQYEQQQQQQQQSAGYGSDDDSLHGSGHRNRERKRGTPWTEEEHKLFLMGLNQVGKGDWRGISRNFVKTRTPTQVASHAQKYFLRKTNLNRRRRRSSLFDITTDTMSRSASAGQLVDLDTQFQPKPAIVKPTLFSTSALTKLLPIRTNMAHTTPVVLSPSSKIANINLNQLPISPPNSSPTSSSISTNDTMRKRDFESFISLKLSPSQSDEESSQPSNSFGGFNEKSDSIISVA